MKLELTGSIVLVVGAFCGVLLILGIILFSCAWHIVEINNIGLMYNKNYFKVTDKVYGAGRHLSGIGNKFIMYPTTFQIMEFVSSNSNDRRRNMLDDRAAIVNKISYSDDLGVDEDEEEEEGEELVQGYD